MYHSSLQIHSFSWAPKATLFTASKLKEPIFIVQNREVEALH